MTSVFFDLETAGLTEKHPNIQIAAVAVDSNWNELGTFERKIKFDSAKADREALALNSYNADIWQSEAVDEYKACMDFADFLNPYRCLMMTSRRTGKPYTVALLVGHNAATFDGPRLQLMLKHHNMFLPADPRVRCTAQKAMDFFDCRQIQPKSYRLSDLCEHFGISVVGAHDALCDARLTVALAKKLRQEMGVSITA
jgi:DNA polymerase III epsilon subunit-like protein